MPLVNQCLSQWIKTCRGCCAILEMVDLFLAEPTLQQILPMIWSQGQLIQQSPINAVPRVDIRQGRLWNYQWRRALLSLPSLSFCTATSISILTIKSGF